MARKRKTENEQRRGRHLEPWLNAALDYIPSWLDFQLRALQQPGCAIAVCHRGQLIFERAFGSANCQTREALTPRHRFRIASHSKSFTAAGILKLAERGELRLSDRIDRYVPGVHPSVARATILQLLSHGAGISRDGRDCDYFYDRRPYPTADTLLGELQAPALIRSDSRFKYSNIGFALLGLIIEAVTREPYNQWIEREIVKPIGLPDTTPDMPLPEGALFARAHTDAVLLGNRVIVPGDYRVGALVSALGFVSTAGDVARFFAQLSPRAEQSLLSPATRRKMIRPRWRHLHSSLELRYGLGTTLGQVGDWSWFGHSGGLQGYLARTKVIPTHDLAISILANSADAPIEAWINGVIHILRAFHKRGAPSPAVRDWKGRWWWLWGVIDLIPIGDTVILANPRLDNPLLDASEARVTSVDTARVAASTGFLFYRETMRRSRDTDGRVREIWLGGDRLVSEQERAAEVSQRYGGAVTPVLTTPG